LHYIFEKEGNRYVMPWLFLFVHQIRGVDFRPCLVHRKNIGRSKESDSYRKFHCSSVWNKGRESNRFRGKAMKPAVLEERKNKV
jgi:hypothetical protein